MRQPFRILFVCTGNMCRSPLAERLARARLLGRGAVAVEVMSAGTHAVVGAPVHSDTADVLLRLGGDPAGFTARQLTEEIIGSADLILTATAAHREFVVAMCPGAVGRAFTILEFCALAATVPAASVKAAADAPGRARALTAAVSALRREMADVPPGGLDIPDPVGRPMAVQEATALAIARALDRPLALIAGDAHGPVDAPGPVDARGPADAPGTGRGGGLP
jgi:low molecular weight protein-tyrosine phosphatase